MEDYHPEPDSSVFVSEAFVYDDDAREFWDGDVGFEVVKKVLALEVESREGEGW